jgi:glycosyltransferase involved in cell wall biosynthesis
MNILFLSCWYPTKENSLKGIFVKNHAAAIKAGGNGIRVIALDIATDGSIFKKEVNIFIDENGIETYLISIKSIFYKWLYINPYFIRKTFYRYYQTKLSQHFSPDIIHSNILYPCAIAGDFLSAKLTLPHIITEHWSKVDKYMRLNVLSHLGKRAYNQAGAIAVVSNFLKENIKKYVTNSEKIHIVPNIVDYAFFSYKEKMLPNEQIVFTAIAHWKTPKRPELFIHALDIVQKQLKKNIVLNIVGEGPQLDEIKKMKFNFQINYLGNVPREKVSEILHKSNYFLHASSIETFSLVVAEALATGTPVVCSNAGALPELVTETNGILTENTPEAWVQAINTIISRNYANQQISEASSKQYESQQVGKLFSDIYYSIKN